MLKVTAAAFVFACVLITGCENASAVSFRYKNDIYVFFNDEVIEERVDGNVYSFFSVVEVAPQGFVGGDILIISGRFMSQVLTIIQFFICILFFTIKRGFFEQGCALLMREPLTAARNGLIVYFIVALLALVFALSIVLIPLSFFFIIIIYLAISAGQASVGLLIGYFIIKNTGKTVDTFFYMLVGVVLIFALNIAFNMIPRFGFILNAFVLSVLPLGVTITCLLNGFVEKKFFAPPFSS